MLRMRCYDAGGVDGHVRRLDIEGPCIYSIVPCSISFASLMRLPQSVLLAQVIGQVHVGGQRSICGGEFELLQGQ